MNNDTDMRIDRLIGLGLGLLALGVYLATLSIGAYPGASADYIVQATGLFPRLSPLNPLWNGISLVLSDLPFGGLAVKLNVFSALCGALSIWLMYQVVSMAIMNVIDLHIVSRPRALMASRLGGVAAALFLAFCIPFWIASNRAHIASFDVLMLLGLTRLFLGYLNTGSRNILLLFAFLYGLAVVEFATMIVLAPLFGGYLLFDLWKREELNAGIVIQAVLAGLVGVMFYFAAAWFFYRTEGYAMRGFENYFQVVWFMWREQYALLSRSLPRVGWLIVLVMTTVPWLMSLLVARRALNEEKEWTYYVLHAVMTGLVVSVMLNCKFAPWPLLRASRFLVSPYVLTAATFGYLVAYWYLLPSMLWRNSESPGLVKLGERLGAILAVPFLAFACGMPFVNIHQAGGRASDCVNTYAREVIKNLAPEQKWLVTDGSIDNHLLIAAADMGRAVQLLNIRLGDSAPYMKYIAGKFDKPRLMNMAKTGMLPLLQEWMQTDPEISGKLSIMWPCDLWVGAGYSVVPKGLVFNGVKDAGTLDVTGLVSANRRTWTALVPLLKDQVKDPVMCYHAVNLLRNISLSAVNLGCLVDELGRKDEAFDLYCEARDIYPENISALLNLSALVTGGYKTDKAEAIRNDMKTLVSKPVDKRNDIWTLSRSYGYVRTPEAFGRLGLMWAFSGQPGAAIMGLKKAVELLPDDKKGAAKQNLADVYLAQEHDDDSESLYYELLVENPANQRALMGMARVSARKRELKQAIEYLKKAENAGVAKTVITLEMASFNLMAGNLAQARIALEEVVDLKPDGIPAGNIARAWLMLIGIYAQQRDVAALQECTRRISENRTLSMSLLMIAKGHVALVQNNIPEARASFESVLNSMPNNLSTLELLLRLDVLESRKDEAEKRVAAVLRMDPNNALGNYIRGTLQFHAREYTLAEDSYRKSLERKKSPEVMNDLAWLLQNRGETSEAEKLSRASLAIHDKNAAAWDTLGVILTKTGKHDEAEKAFERSIALSPAGISVIVHMAQLQVLKGNKAKAVELIGMLAGRRAELSADNSSELEKVKKALDSM